MPKNGEITDTTYVFSCDPYLTEADQDAVTADAGMDIAPGGGAGGAGDGASGRGADGGRKMADIRHSYHRLA